VCAKWYVCICMLVSACVAVPTASSAGGAVRVCTVCAENVHDLCLEAVALRMQKVLIHGFLLPVPATYRHELSLHTLQFPPCPAAAQLPLRSQCAAGPNSPVAWCGDGVAQRSVQMWPYKRGCASYRCVKPTNVPMLSSVLDGAKP